MGIEHRDYYRHSSRGTYSPSGFADMPIVCKRLLLATAAVFLLQLFVTRPAEVVDLPAPVLLDQIQTEEWSDESADEYAQMMMQSLPRVSIIQQWAELDPNQVKRGQVWRLVTYMFCHDRFGVWHLLVNMLFLYWLGTRLEQMYGSTEFCLFYFAAGVSAAIAFLALDYYTGSSAVAIGASGAVWGLVALYVIHHPYERINLYGMFPVEMRWLALLYLIFDLHPVLMAINGEGMISGGGVAHAAHLGGAAFGLIYFQRGWRLTPILNRMTGQSKNATWRSNTVVRNSRDVIQLPRPDFSPPDERIDPQQKRLEAQLDQVLEKIQSEGRESLSDDEVQILAEASRRMRDR